MRLPGFLLADVTLVGAAGSSARAPVPQEALWTEFMAWFRGATVGWGGPGSSVVRMVAVKSPPHVSTRDGASISPKGGDRNGVAVWPADRVIRTSHAD